MWPQPATRRSLADDPALVTKVILVICGVVYLAQVATGGNNGDVALRLDLQSWQVADGEWWRIVTSGFVHYGLLHLLFNGWFIWVLGGQLLEPGMGHVRYAALFLTSLVWGSAGALVWGVLQDEFTRSGGASGAAYGLLGAALVGLAHRRVEVWRTELFGLLVVNLLITFALPGISIGGHIGGLIGGALCGAVMLRPGRHGEADLAWAGALTVAGFALALWAASA